MLAEQENEELTKAQGPAEILSLLRGAHQHNAADMNNAGVAVTTGNHFHDPKLANFLSGDAKESHYVSTVAKNHLPSGCHQRFHKMAPSRQSKVARERKKVMEGLSPTVATKGSQATVSMMSTGATN